MIKSYNTLYHTEEDLIKLRNDVGPYDDENVLIQIFTYLNDLEAIESIKSEVLEVFPNTNIIGSSTAGEIFEGKAYDKTTVISFTKFEETKVKTLFIDGITRSISDLEEQADYAAKALSADDLKAIIMFSYGVTPNYTYVNVLPFITRLKKHLPDSIFSGGVAGVYNFDSTKLSSTFTESKSSHFGIAIAGLYGKDLSVINKYNLSWIPIGKKLVVQDAQDYHLKLLDGMTPAEVFKTYLGEEIVAGLPMSSAEFPLVLERGGKQMLIHPSRIYDDGTFEMTHHLHVGEQVKFSFCHVGLLALSANKIYNELLDEEIQTNFMYSCAIRRNVLGEDIIVELSPMADLSNSAGFFAYGEFFDEGVDEYHRLGQTTTVLGLREGKKTDEPVEEQKLPSYKFTERRQFRTMRVLHRLVDKSASDLEMALITLSQLAHKDALTGLYNRGYFDQKIKSEMKRQGRTDSPLSLILIDIDYFKNFNDTYGHVSGDDALRGVGACLNQLVTRTDDVVARYGGEELALILPHTDYLGAELVAEKIRASIESLEIPHKSSLVSDVLTVSVGFVTLNEPFDVEEGFDSSLLIEACDRCLYEAKENGRNRIMGTVYKK
ncbi:diguanylate cyclase [Acidaminobacter sp. JC074]|uniref:sensor domain-containing diguanylate cyclase n=1 Tax=Acidaminobacter sp. JC074 TaxID=2530199 RepID=UPI001F109448|nr:diguanylate cyclase [Acidaminobacter sp. JC074]MCH4890092.1 diguanylate cyclase [Acidaminobacter sp. JC074]